MHFPIHHLLQLYGYQGIFFSLLFEMLGIPFPGETILTLSGIEWKQGTFSFIPLILVTLAGNITGSSIAYLIGRFLGRAVILRFGKFLGISDKKFIAAEEKFNKYRVLVVLFGKFIAGIRVLAAYLAGINRMDFWKFSFYNAMGSFVWILVFIVLGQYVGIAWQHYHQYLFQFFILTIIMIILLIAFISLFYKLWIQKKSW